MRISSLSVRLRGYRTLRVSRSLHARSLVLAPPADGPHDAKGPPYDIVGKIWKNYKYFEWWDSEDDGTYVGYEKSISFLAEVATRRGPFDGIFGFSQGGSLAGTLCASKHSNDAFGDDKELNESRKTLLRSVRFGALFGAFEPRDEVFLKALATAKDSKTDDMSLWMTCGKKDADYCRNAMDAIPKHFGADGRVDVVWHPGGHELPTKRGGGEDAIRSLRDFLQKHRGK